MAARRDSASSGTVRSRGPVATVVHVVAELLITAGLIMLLFVAWQLWWTNIAAGSAQADAVDRMKRDFSASQADAASGASSENPPVAEAPKNGEGIGIMYIPRFGAQYERPIIQGSGTDVLDTLGVGHYPSTSMPGAVGNFAVAGHRQTNGAVFDRIDRLVAGDRIYIRTAQGYYTYVFRNNEIVVPSSTDVLAPTPGQPGEAAKDRLLTMTSCNPRFGSSERIIAYAAFERWQPAADGPPREIADIVGKDR